jgi:hypothetical protein
MRRLTGGGRSGAPLAGGRGLVSTGIGLVLVAVGAVLLFGLNHHVIGVIVIFAGVIGLLLPSRARVRRWINPSGIDDPSVHDVQSAVSADVAQLHESDSLFDLNGPGDQRDEL